MGIIERLFLWIFGEPRKIENEFWGKMTDADTYYECRKFFNPIGKTIELRIEGREEGNNKPQRDFFTRIEEEYDLLIEKIKAPLTKKIQTWIKNYAIKEFKRDFEPIYIVIPVDCINEPIIWEISFYEHNELNHWCHIYLSNYEVTGIDIDG